jgi:hypothetical protein
VTLDLVLIGLGIAFDPIPLTAFLVVLPCPGGPAVGPDRRGRGHSGAG